LSRFWNSEPGKFLDEEKVKKGLERLIEKKEVRISYVRDIEDEDLFGLISRVDRAIKQY
jgi:hypothetical protein